MNCLTSRIQATLIQIFAIMIEVALMSYYGSTLRQYDYYQVEYSLTDDESAYFNSYKLLMAGTVIIIVCFIILILLNYCQCNWKKQMIWFIGFILISGWILIIVGASIITQKEKQAFDSYDPYHYDSNGDYYYDESAFVYYYDLSLLFIHTAIVFEGIVYLISGLNNNNLVQPKETQTQMNIIQQNDQL